MSAEVQESKFMIGVRRVAVEAEIVPACPTCAAPGFYINHWSIKQSWPKCYDPTLAAGERVDVGPICPQCRSPRPFPIKYGEVSASMPRWLWRLILAAKRVLLLFIPNKGAFSWK